MDDDEAQDQDEIGRLIADLGKLRGLTEDLSGKMDEVDANTIINPEFIRRSLASIYDSQAVLAESVVRVLEALRAGGREMVRADEAAETEARPKPFLRLVDPDTP